MKLAVVAVVAVVAGLVLNIAAVAFVASAPAAHAEVAARVAIHVDEDDPDRMRLALGNANNIEKYYTAKGEEVEIEIVVIGPGLAMLRADVSPVSEKIAELATHLNHITFSVCANTIAAASKKLGTEIELLPEAEIVPSGAVRLIELQAQGYAYLRP